MYKAPKAIITHPGVEECTSGEQGGSDYKHDIFLKEGWEFKNGRMAGCRSLLCNTVEDFKYAEPVQSAPVEQSKAVTKGSKITKEAVLAALHDNEESGTLTTPDGIKWAGVYLDNVQHDLGCTAHQLAGFLSALEKDGKYKVQDGKDFGYVRVE